MIFHVFDTFIKNIFKITVINIIILREEEKMRAPLKVIWRLGGAVVC